MHNAKIDLEACFDLTGNEGIHKDMIGNLEEVRSREKWTFKKNHSKSASKLMKIQINNFIQEKFNSR